ncbi:glycoside hydrolase family 26 protein [Streptomonospora salina]|uniref:glycoside hydrolase family 26 protein n=1 Tax=Streptomonospora salina TaxID=104205 RepID=UPI0036DC3384
MAVAVTACAPAGAFTSALAPPADSAGAVPAGLPEESAGTLRPSSGASGPAPPDTASGYAAPTGSAEAESAPPPSASRPPSSSPSPSHPSADASAPPAGEPSGPEPGPAVPPPGGDAADGADPAPPATGFPSHSASAEPEQTAQPSPDYPGYPGYPGPAPTPGPSPAPTPAPSPPPSPECTVTALVEPTCGVWWGASPYRGDVEPLETAVGRRLDIVYTWHGVDQSRVPTDEERKLAEEGRFVHANIEAKRFNADGHPAQSYSDIVDGRFDDALRGQARRIADLGTPFFVTFDHEADADKRYNTRGTPEEFVGAWRHIVDLYRDSGAGNAVFVWNVTGWPANLDRLPGLWPGNGYVDWISWEAYNMTGCRLQPDWDHVDTFEEALRPAYEWIQNEGPEHGIAPEKPVMIGEMGTVPIPGDPEATREWYADVPGVLEDYERIRAVKLWDGITAPTCDFRVLQDRHATRGYLQASDHAYVDVPRRAREAVGDAVELADRARRPGDPGAR